MVLYPEALHLDLAAPPHDQDNSLHWLHLGQVVAGTHFLHTTGTAQPLELLAQLPLHLPKGWYQGDTAAGGGTAAAAAAAAAAADSCSQEQRPLLVLHQAPRTHQHAPRN
ncbi:unnamed protein product [Closterium sp. NIES-54]